MKAVAMDHLVLEVRDVDRALGFYRDVLGLPAERLDRFRRGEVPFPSVRVGPLLIDLFVVPDPGPGPNHFCLEVDASPVDLVSALDAAHIAHTEPGFRFGARGDGTSVYVHDPDGHQVEIRTYRS